MSSNVERDAAEFGVHVKAGGWRLGLLVARNVSKGANHGGDRKSDQRRTHDVDGKVSAKEFGRIAGTSADRVLRYLSAWEHAAADGLVPPAHTLTPGEDIDLDVDKLGDWSDYYPPVLSIDHRSPEKRKVIEEAAAAEGTTPEQVQRASASAPAIAAAIKSDPRIAEAAMRALDQKWEQDRATRKAPDTAETKSNPASVLIALRKVRRDLQAAIDLVANGRADDLAEVITTEVQWLRNALDLLETAATSGSFDDGLAALLSQEG